MKNLKSNRNLGKSCLVIGGGPAGTSFSIWMVRQGWKVTLLERRSQIEQKICGECLSPPCRELLEDLGVWSRIQQDQSDQIQYLDGITLIGPHGAKCELDFGGKPPFTIPRPILDQTLLNRAREEGVDIRLNTQILNIERNHSSWSVTAKNLEEFHSELLIGADGRHSWVARKAGLTSDNQLGSLKHTAVMGHFSFPSVPLKSVEMWVTRWGYVGLNPLPGEMVNTIAVLSPSLLNQRLSGKGSSGLLDLLKDHIFGEYAPDALRRRMSGSQPVSNRVWTTSSIAWQPRKIVLDSHRGACALIGDSAGFVDPFTGEGLYHAFASSRRLSLLLDQHPIDEALQHYEKWHKFEFGPEEVFCFRLQKLLPYSKIANYVIAQLGRKPKLNRVLAETVADRLSTRHVLSPFFWSKVLWPTEGVSQ